MATEPKRGCGYRKVGGLYLVSKNVATMPCCRLPIPLTVCPCCGNGIKQQLGFQWVDPKPFLASPCTNGRMAAFCPAADPTKMGDRVGLLWVGGRFYPSVESFMNEGFQMGFSKRIQAIPHGFELGKTWIWLAHPKAVRGPVGSPDTAGVFYIWRPDAIEKIVTASQAQDEKAMEDLAKRKITPIIVPDNDLDHQGSAYDKPKGPELF